MGTWSLWHFAIFIIVAVIAALTGKSATNIGDNAVASLKGYGGWLVILSIFLLFWAAQELCEFYRVKSQLETLIPSVMGDPTYKTYLAYSKELAWLEALVLLACAILPMIKRYAAWAIKAVIAGLWLAGPIAAATELAMADSYFSDYIVEHDYSAVAATILFATTWTCYLLVSRRVKNTYY